MQPRRHDGSPSTAAPSDERYEAEDESWQAPRKIERFFSRLNGEGWIFDRPPHVYVVAADGTTAPRNLTPGRVPARRRRPGCPTRARSSRRRSATTRGTSTSPTDLYLVPPRRRRSPRSPSRPASTARRRCRPTARGSRSSAHDDSADRPAERARRRADRWRPASDTLGQQRPRPHVRDDGGTVAPGVDRRRHLLATAEDRGQTPPVPHRHRRVEAPERLTDGRTAGCVRGRTPGGTIGVHRQLGRPAAELFVLGDGSETPTDPPRRRATRDRQAAAVGALRWCRRTDGTVEIDAWIMRPADFDETKRYPGDPQRPRRPAHAVRRDAASTRRSSRRPPGSSC